MKRICILGLALAFTAGSVYAQGLTLPPGGDNQKASVSQWIGLVEVSVTYNSPDVTSPTGEDRTGKIWGQLVPYGMANLGFGTCGEECPWRAGANENTVFTVSHDVEVEGKPLPAGSYGLHMVPGEEEWTIIFSKNHSSWGSFFYDPSEDALRVTVEPKESPYTHWLTYEFVDRQPAEATVALKWENLMVPWTVSVGDLPALYLAKVRDELRGTAGFNHLNWAAAASYTLSANVNLEEGLTWAQSAVSAPFIGQEDFATLSTLGRLQLANGLAVEGEETLVKAVRHATATPFGAHGLGRQLIGEGRLDLAMKVFEANYEQQKGAWPTEVGLARGYSAMGQYDKALAHARTALEQAPNDPARANLQGLVERLEKGEDINS